MSETRVRLNRYLAASGVCSRRAADRIILTEKVKVNGRPVTELGTKIDPNIDRVTVNGRRVVASTEVIFIALNKPRGYLTTMKDERGRKCVKDLVKGVGGRVFPVGRLDKDTEGLLLFSNDGFAAHRLMHPSFGVEKVYRVTLDKPLSGKQLSSLKQGVVLVDGVARVSKVRRLQKEGEVLELTIKEGRKREVRRIFRKLGPHVIRLQRVKFGPIVLGGLSRGKWRRLSKAEISQIRKAIRIE